MVPRYGRNDVDAQIGTAIRDGSSFYTLTYRPSNDSNDPRKFRRIRVTVSRPGLTVFTREGYYLQYGPGRVDPQKPSRLLVNDLIAAESSTMAYDGVPLSVRRPPADPTAFTTLIRALDSNVFAERERAALALRRLESDAVPALRDRLGRAESAEVKQRLAIQPQCRPFCKSMEASRWSSARR